MGFTSISVAASRDDVEVIRSCLCCWSERYRGQLWQEVEKGKDGDLHLQNTPVESGSWWYSSGIPRQNDMPDGLKLSSQHFSSLTHTHQGMTPALLPWCQTNPRQTHDDLQCRSYPGCLQNPIWTSRQAHCTSRAETPHWERDATQPD